MQADCSLHNAELFNALCCVGGGYDSITLTLSDQNPDSEGGGLEVVAKDWRPHRGRKSGWVAGWYVAVSLYAVWSRDMEAGHKGGAKLMASLCLLPLMPVLLG